MRFLIDSNRYFEEPIIYEYFFKYIKRQVSLSKKPPIIEAERWVKKMDDFSVKDHRSSYIFSIGKNAAERILDDYLLNSDIARVTSRRNYERQKKNYKNS